MSKKRRMFDVEMPDEVETFPAGKVAPEPSKPRSRRGPMAAAISETADSLAERQEVEAKIRAENDALAHEHVRLKKLGLIVDLIPLGKIETGKLIRDRVPGLDEEMEGLKMSIAEIGLSNPIRVEARTDGDYELIQGMRRITAFRALLEETGDAEKYGAIPAAILPHGESMEGLYRQMVDENLVRKDISFAEMALLALHYSTDPTTTEEDPDKAVAILFKSANYQKRSYIRRFIRVMRSLDSYLQFPQEIPRALGISLAARMDEVEGIPNGIRKELADMNNRSVEEELAVLRRFAEGGADALPEETFPGGKKEVAKPRSAKTTFQVSVPGGTAKCTASPGRLELRMQRDFSALERRKLEQAIEKLLRDLS